MKICNRLIIIRIVEWNLDRKDFGNRRKNQKSAKMTIVEKIGVNFFEQYRAWGLYVYTDADARTPKRTLHRRFLRTCAVLPYFSAFYTALTLN